MPAENRIATIGSVALNRLAQSALATVTGSTQSGLFLHLPGDWVIFLTDDVQRGPLTLNVAGGMNATRGVTLHSRVTIDAGRLIFDAGGRRLSFQDAKKWSAPPVGKRLAPQAVQGRLEAVVGAVRSVRSSGLLDAALPMPDARTEWQPLLDILRPALAAGSAPEILAALTGFLGRGTGLTPSGDDFVMGVLLGLRRHGVSHVSALDTEVLAQDLVSAARRRTTMLSACLIECASAGQADERLVVALDGIVSGAAEIYACSTGLLSWGNSSGLDALAGMVAVFMQ